MSDIYKEFGVDLLCARHAGPTAAEMKMAQEITRLRAEVQEQARVRGMCAEREAKLLARVDVLERALRRIQATPHPSVAAQCTGCHSHQKTATYALEDAAP